MAALPNDGALDNTLPLLWQGYEFISGKCHSLDSDVFQTRLLLRDVICMQGAEAAALFYDQDKFQRNGAMPSRAQKTLVGVGGVQGLDGHAHRHRKHLFVSHLMNPQRMDALAALHRQHWHSAIALWPQNKDLVFFELAQQVLCRSVCAWAGVPLSERQLSDRAKEFGLMIDSGARIGWHHWRGRLARQSCEAWISGEIKKVRASSQKNDSILHAFALYCDESGQLLPTEIAAVELINVLRPTVAIAQLATFSMLAMHQYPHIKERLQMGDADYLEWFVLEVRRFYPFFPFLAAYTRSDFTWKGFEFSKGTLVLLDIYGTNHDGRHWEYPEEFNPLRFKHWDAHPFRFIANGGATYEQHHRCPGEWITNQLMKVIIQFWLKDVVYEIPHQDLTVSLRSIPALPKSRMIIRPISYQSAA